MHYSLVKESYRERRSIIMSKEYYQMGWTLDDTYQEDYFCSRDNQRYFIKKILLQ